MKKHYVKPECHRYVERWKGIEEYEGLYQVSTLGNVKSLNYRMTGKEKILKPGENRGGYLQVTLWKDGKQKNMTVHRLVATAFIQRPDLFSTEVNHIDENKHNNVAWNLEWCEHQYNINYGTHNQRVAEAKTNGLTSKAVIGISVKDGSVINFPSTAEAGRQGFHQGAVCSCCRGKLNKYKGYIWKYA